MRLIIPFREKEAANSWPVELLSGKFPRFVFGLPVGHSLPVFRFSRVNRLLLEPYLVYLMENGYRTLGAEEMQAVVLGERERAPREVVLTFDHGWASLWTVAAPLLRRYGFRAIGYVIPGRVKESMDCRPILGEPEHDPDVDRSADPFANWGELMALAEEGVLELHSNSWSHARIFSHDKFLRLIEPETRLPSLSWPVISEQGHPLHFLSPSHVFHPLLPTRSRLSDGMRHEVDPSVVRRIHDDPDAAPYLFKQHFLQIETEEEREEAIRYELAGSRKILSERLQRPVRHLAFPWGVCGRVARRLIEDCGYETAFAETRCSSYVVRRGQDPHQLGRLPFAYIRALPGRRRKLFWRIRFQS